MRTSPTPFALSLSKRPSQTVLSTRPQLPSLHREAIQQPRTSRGLHRVLAAPARVVR